MTVAVYVAEYAGLAATDQSDSVAILPEPAIAYSKLTGGSQISAPVQADLVGGAGGALADGVYQYVVTALNANGETIASNEKSVTLANGSAIGDVTVSWGAVSGATGYKVYRTAVGGASGTEKLTATPGNVTSYDDLGDPDGTVSPPTVNTTGAAVAFNAATKFVEIVSDGAAQIAFAGSVTSASRPLTAGVAIIRRVMDGGATGVTAS